MIMKNQPFGTWMQRAFPALSALVLMVGILFCPGLTFSSLLEGFELAFCRVVPAVFPLMVISGIIMESPLTFWLGIPLVPYTKALGIKDHSAATVLFLGLLGGFAVLSQGIQQLYQSRRIDREQAELLLCAGMNVGPAFILLSVGYGMFHSMQLGILFLISLYLGNLAAALLMRCFTKKRAADFEGKTPQTVYDGTPGGGTFISSIQRSVTSCLILCGTIAFFYLVCSLLKKFLPAAVAAVFCSILEVTNGAVQASAFSGGYRIYLALLVMSWAGISIHQQSRALLPKEIRLKKFYLSRLPAGLISLILFSLLLRWFPTALTTSVYKPLRVSRFSWEIFVSFFLMVAAFLYECTPKKTLRTRGNRL